MDIMNFFNQARQSGLRMHDMYLLPRDFQDGGSVLHRDMNIPKSLLLKGDVDTVLARVQPGEIVIPKRHTRKVAAFLRKEKIKLPNLK